MGKVGLSSENWKRFCYSVNNDNPLHWDDSIAKGFDYYGLVAPPMYIASLLDGSLDDEICGIDSFYSTFPVYAGDYEMGEVESNSRGRDFVFRNEGGVEISEARGVHFGIDEVFENKDGEVVDDYSGLITHGNVGLYFNSLGFDRIPEAVPFMYAASLIEPAVLTHNWKSGQLFLPCSHQFHFARRPEFGDISLVMRSDEEQGLSHIYDIDFMQGGKLIGNGFSIGRVLNYDGRKNG